MITRKTLKLAGVQCLTWEQQASCLTWLIINWRRLKKNKIQVLTLVFKQKLVMTFSDLMIR